MSSTGRRPLKIVTGVSGSPDVYTAAVDPLRSTIASAVEIAELAEANGFDALFAADLLSFGAQGAIGAQEPLIFLAALSAVTSRIGLIATVTTTFHHPYNLARLFGTLDHVSNGRAAWNAVTSSLGEENYGGGDLPRPQERYRRATESIEVVNALFDSWRPGALSPDGHGGVRLDPAFVQPIDYDGEFFTVRGPLNIPALPQRRPVQFQAGQSEGGIELGARFAEVVFTSLPTLEDALVYTKKIRSRAAEWGRAEGLPLIMSSFHATYGSSEAEVRRLVREREEATDFDAGRLALADMLGGDIDLSELPLDQPIPERLLPDVRSVQRRQGRVEIFNAFARSGKTLRELIIAAKDTGHWAAAGTPEQLADAIAERYDAGVLDVITLGGLADPRTRDFLLNGLLPELRHRRIVETGYRGRTLRENLELPDLPD